MDIFAMGANRCPYQHDAEGAMFDDAIANLVRARPKQATLA
ncbi:hypothetical protein [Mameliella sp. CS4]|nr:hypothetical protein [Mameliella sp. CS4]